MTPGLDFGYPWWISYGHLVVAVPAAVLWIAARAHRWPRWITWLTGAVSIWSIAAFLIARFALNVNGPMSLPSQTFLQKGQGRVLDMGAGTGRSSLMVLEARPRATVVALDLFADSYKQHFGPEVSGQSRLSSNLKAAGFEQRTAIQAGDMRQLPFESATFDGVVSTYAIDHLGRDGIARALSEASRVLKPGGDFLLEVIAKDLWLKFTFGPLLLHSGTHGQEWWANQLQSAGFQVAEQGTRPATLYFLARKQ